MNVVLFLWLLYSSVNSEYSELKQLEEIADLQLSFVIHRHGDRTPVSYFSYLSDDPERDARLSYPFGDGGLTLEGRTRGYEIGKYLRRRYNKLLSDLYFNDEIYLRSTDTDRSKMTMLTSLAGLYPPKTMLKWKGDLDWQPIPYTTEPARQDFLTFFNSCERIIVQDFFESPIAEMSQKYRNLTEILNINTSYNFTGTPLKILAFYDLLFSQMAIGVQPSSWVLPLLDELYDATSFGMKYMFRTDLMKKLAGGVFFNEFFNVADKIVAGGVVKQRVRIYSTHDVNVAAQLSTGRLPLLAPKYGSVLSIELYKVRKTGQYIVVPIFLPQAGASNPKILLIDGCQFLYCNYHNYKELLEPYLITEEEQRKECRV